MKSPKYSIIVPAYNVENFVERCINSLLDQTEQDFEIIIVNDGSTDRTPIILKEKYSNYSNIKILSQKNAGLSSARNTGIKNATGEWLVFVDTDDWVETNMLNRFSLLLKEYPQIDFLTNDAYENDLPKHSGYKTGFIKDKLPLIEGIVELNYGSYKYHKTFNRFRNVHGKLYNTNLLKAAHLLFDPEVFGFEDAIFNLHYLNYCQNIYFERTPTYHYNTLNENSITHTADPLQAKRSKINLAIVKKYLDDNHIITPAYNYLVFNAYRNIYNSLTILKNHNTKKSLHVISSFDKDYASYLHNFNTSAFTTSQRLIYLLLKRKHFRLLYYLFLLKNARRRHS